MFVRKCGWSKPEIASKGLQEYRMLANPPCRANRGEGGTLASVPTGFSRRYRPEANDPKAHLAPERFSIYSDSTLNL